MDLSRLLGVAILAASLPHVSFALDAKDIARAEKILRVVVDLTAKYPNATGSLVAPTPLADSSGKYHLPYRADGSLTDWANKSINAQVGAAVGEKVGEKAGGALISRAVPMGGLLSGAAKKKGKELGAVAAVGGFEAIKSSSELSFNSLDDYAVYLHVKHAGTAGYAQGLATSMAIYPELEKRYDRAIRAAFERAEAASKAQKALEVAQAAKAAAL